MAVRKIVRIDEEKCNGCGLCVTPCAEGAIELADGKARVIKDELCDGAGFCLSICPTGALIIEEREAADFDPQAAQEKIRARLESGDVLACHECGTKETQQPLLACRIKGEGVWICVRCLPRLIHG